MDIELYDNIYAPSEIPVIVCAVDDDMSIVYINGSACMLLNPSLSVEALMGKGHVELAELMRFHQRGGYENMLDVLNGVGKLYGFGVTLRAYDGTQVHANIYANHYVAQGRKLAIFNIFRQTEQSEDVRSHEAEDILAAALREAHQTVDPDEAIHNILSLAGNFARVSRVYVFEVVSDKMTSNTYEWCAPGVQSAMQMLKSLPAEDYSYDTIMKEGGMYITSDARQLPENDREILQEQGIKAMAVLPMFHFGDPQGYVGFDDTENYRPWARFELQFLKNVAGILSTLLDRRDTERQLLNSRTILNTISDYTSTLVYVNDIHTYEVKYANRMLCKAIGKAQEEVVGKPCWQVLQAGQTGPCAFCPQKKMLDAEGTPIKLTYSWEFQNTIDKKWYLAEDSINKWVNGEYVHIESCVDITLRKQYEFELSHYAFTDTMTDSYNRAWGMQRMQELMDGTVKSDGRKYSIVFVDIDGLKNVNDTFGHNVGDDLLVLAAKVMRESIRKNDMLARWGGDEFLMMLECDAQAAEIAMQNIQEKMGAINETGEKPYELSFSYGITDFPVGTNQDVDEYIRRADASMYHAKLAKKKARAVQESER